MKTDLSCENPGCLACFLAGLHHWDPYRDGFTRNALNSLHGIDAIERLDGVSDNRRLRDETRSLEWRRFTACVRGKGSVLR